MVRSVRDARRDSRRRLERLMDADEIVVHERNRHRIGEHVGLFAESVRKSRGPAILHSDIEVLPLRETGRNVVRVRIGHALDYA